jgi:exodeoxyribonuclease VII small subunit
MTETDNNEPQQAPADDSEEALGKALENTLANLTESIERMEEIVNKFESGDAELDDSIRLLSEANDLAVSSSKELDQAVQKVVYQAEDESGSEINNEAEDESAGEELQDS